MQSETGFPSSHQLKSYVASKSRLKSAARAVLSADAGLLVVIRFCVSRRRRKMYCRHARLCVCVSVCVTVRGRTPTLLHEPGCNLGAW